MMHTLWALQGQPDPIFVCSFYILYTYVYLSQQSPAISDFFYDSNNNYCKDKIGR